jgi:hypothetical protein
MLFFPPIPWEYGDGVLLLTILVILRMSEVIISPERIVQKFHITGIRREFSKDAVSAISCKNCTDHKGKQLLSIVIYDQRDRKIVLSSRVFMETYILVAQNGLRNHYEKKFLDY